MLVNSVIIVLREVLEAALMISILLALSHRTRLGRGWLVAAACIGLAAAALYANFLGPVSALFDGAGQEVINSALQVGVFLALVVTVFVVARRRGDAIRDSRVLPIALAASVAFAMTQEGAEIYVYVAGFLQIEEFVSNVSIGSLTGAGIGFSVGVLFYYVLLSLSERRALVISLILLGFVAASMCIQVANQLIQADWLQAGAPLWNTSSWIREDSLIGQMLYALAGYEATPSAVEAAMYGVGLAAIMLAALAGWRLLPHAPEA